MDALQPPHMPQGQALLEAQQNEKVHPVSAILAAEAVGSAR